MGGGKSVGKQSSNVTQSQRRLQRPQVPVTLPQPSPLHQRLLPAAAPKKPWGAMLGGLAAGLGLAWLASSLGLGGRQASARC